MMMNEFVERTGYMPTEEEYRFIEDSYYEAEDCVDKNQFCARWKKDKASGAWDRELTLRRTMALERENFRKKMEDKEENLEWYRQEYAKQLATIRELKDWVEEMDTENKKLKEERASLDALLEAIRTLKEEGIL